MVLGTTKAAGRAVTEDDEGGGFGNDGRLRRCGGQRQRVDGGVGGGVGGRQWRARVWGEGVRNEGGGVVGGVNGGGGEGREGGTGVGCGR